LNQKQPRAQAVAISDGHIIAVGSNDEIEEYIDDSTSINDVNGKTILPGFIDSHTHVFFGGLVAEAVDLSAARTFDDLIIAISKYAAKVPPGTWIRGCGYSVDHLIERRHPTRQVLDQATTDHPVWVTTDSFHSSAANSRGFEAIGLEANNPGLERDSAGEPTGVYLTDGASQPARRRVFSLISDAEAARMIRLIAQQAAQAGITTIHALEGSRMDGDRDLKILLAIRESLPIDVLPYYETFDVAGATRMKVHGIGGCGRCNLDGMPNEFTAALFEPYADRPGAKGTLHYTQVEVDEYILNAYAQGVQVCMHAMGDAAIEQLLVSHERAQLRYPNTHLRHRIEHCHMPNEGQIKRAAKLGLILAMQPVFAHLWGLRDGVFHRRLGDTRYQRTERYRDLIDAGCVVTTGADLPVLPAKPFLWISLMVNNPVDPAQSISIDEALRLAIYNGAFAAFEENKKGTIERGKWADVILLDRDPYVCSSSELSEIQVEATISRGKIVFQKSAMQ